MKASMPTFLIDRNIRLILILCLLIFCAPISLNAQSINGRVFSSFYSWEREVFGMESTRYIQMYNGLILHINQIGNKNISFHNYIRFGNVLQGDDLEIKHKLYNAYFEWNRIFNRANISFGRQFIWAGVGNGTLDGGKGEIDFKKWGKLGGYAGTLVPLRESWKVDSWASSHMVGAYYKAQFFNTYMQVSWVRKNRRPVEYVIPGQYTGQKVKTSSLIAHLAGIDLSRKFADKLTIYARTEATIQKKKINPDRFEFSADYMPISKITITCQYFYRNPRQNLNSIFSVFSQTHNQEVWLNIYYYLKSSYSLFGGMALVKYGDENTKRLNVGFSSPYLGLGAHKYFGYAGNLDNVYFSGQYPVRINLWAKGSISVGRYKLYEDAVDYNNMVTSSAGFTYQPRPSMTFDIEGQGLRNKLSKTDYRVFCRFNYWFFIRNPIRTNRE